MKVCDSNGQSGELELVRGGGSIADLSLRPWQGVQENGGMTSLGLFKSTEMVFVALLSLLVSSRYAQAAFVFGEPTNLREVIPVIDPAWDTVDCFSSDGLEVYISSYGRPGGYGDADIWVSKRASVDAAWGPLENLGSSVNTSLEDSFSSISSDGLTLYFSSNREAGSGWYDVYMTTRASRDGPWGPAVNLGPKVNSSTTDGEPWIAANGLELYFESRRGGQGQHDIYVMRRPTEEDPWGEPENLGPVVNSEYREQFLSLSPDGLLLLFSDHPNCGVPRPGGYGRADMWMTRRASLSDPWQAPVNLGPQVNGPGADFAPRISPDGSMLYFGTDQTGQWENCQAPIIPILDFNSDGKVDDGDVLMLQADWGGRIRRVTLARCRGVMGS